MPLGVVSGAVEGVHDPGVGGRFDRLGDGLGLFGQDTEGGKGVGENPQHGILGGDVDVGDYVLLSFEGDLPGGAPPAADNFTGGGGGGEGNIHGAAAVGGAG